MQNNALFAMASALIAPAAMTGTAHAQIYVSGSIGANDSSDVSYKVLDGFSRPTAELTRVDKGWTGTLAVGKQFGDWRAEVGYSYNDWDEAIPISSPVVTMSPGGNGLVLQTFDLMGYYNFPLPGQLKPYVGLGIGIGQAKLDDRVVNGSESTTHFQVVAGVAATVWSNLAAFAEARWHSADVPARDRPGAPSALNSDERFTAFGVQAGLRLSF